MNKGALRVAIVGELDSDAERIVVQLSADGYQVDSRRVDREPDLQGILDQPPDLILAEWRLPGCSGSRVLELLHARGMDIPVIVVSGIVGEEAAIDAIRRGAYDYVPVERLAHLGQAVEQALAEKRIREARKTKSVASLVGGVAHDLNNLLTVINGHSDLLLRKLDEQNPFRDPVSEIRKAGEEAAKLTHQLLTFSRKKAGIAEEVTSRNHLPARGSERSAATVSVLLADDSDVIRAVFGEILREAGYRVAEAASVEEMRQQLSSLAVDVALVDLHMPGRGNWGAVREMQRQYPDLKVVVISGEFDGAAADGKSLGVDLLLGKPIDPQLLVETVRNLARNPRAGQAGATQST